MRIGIDARLNAYRQGGIAQYTHQLLTHMVGQLGDDALVVLEHRRQSEPLVRGPQVRHARLLTPPHNRWEPVALPLELLPQRLDLLHCPDFVAPRMRPCPAVVTIHDLAFVRFPEILDADAKRYYSQVRTSAHAAQAVIAVSEATRNDIVELLDLPAERIDVVYEAAAPHFRPLQVAAHEERSINGVAVRANTFLLFVSTIEPRKNLSTLLRALHLCRERNPQAGYRLVIAGVRGWLDGPIFDLLRDLGLGEAVDLLGWPAPDDLVWLYAACRMYLNPSLYEGFGLPVLEALACGAPTVVADTSSLPEVAGEAALRVPPQDVAAWAEVISRVWEDAALRQDLRTRGPAQAARFSWQRAARETLAIYRRVGG
ncbi:glycosyl transferase group 1 [Oscillochloris trichoides DG-6]|uniref:Glycosyl transferase group 1 n=1 Tax=Oscillochloris trichoides DG-6 TaxID=765420 RepID=E1IHA0_9CHLR|nr:glycosyltransferase family 1 protein [Oscillochloris trichoides]EFO79575.1 glycosyl transferase group 1 [Oscillochloris trichoides DG-6]